jgi:hypothetical protein
MFIITIMAHNQKGFGIIVILFFVVIVCLAGLAAVYVKSSIADDNARTERVSGNACADLKTPKVVFFTYGNGTSAERLQEIIDSVEASVTKHHEDIHTYSLTVPKGSEDEAVKKLDTYPEVASARRQTAYCPF